MLMRDELKKAIGSHTVWRGRLRSAIETSHTDWDIEQLKDYENCPFGEWLEGLSPEVRSTNECRKVIEAHKQFHREASHVLWLATSGQNRKASSMIEGNGIFHYIFQEMTQAMMDWMRKLP